MDGLATQTADGHLLSVQLLLGLGPDRAEHRLAGGEVVKSDRGSIRLKSDHAPYQSVGQLDFPATCTAGDLRRERTRIEQPVRSLYGLTVTNQSPCGQERETPR